MVEVAAAAEAFRSSAARRVALLSVSLSLVLKESTWVDRSLMACVFWVGWVGWLVEEDWVGGWVGGW